MPSSGRQAEPLHHNTRADFPTPIDGRTVLYAAKEWDRSGPWLWALDVPSKASRRVSFGLEQYTSLAASADGRRVWLRWPFPLRACRACRFWTIAEERDAQPFSDADGTGVGAEIWGSGHGLPVFYSN